MADLRVGIVGCGGAGIAHWQYFSVIPGCKVTKFLDPKEAGRERARALSSDLKVTDTEEAFFQDLDSVSVCTPDSTHADYLVKALARGLHVLCEKPLTDSLEGIRRIDKAHADSDRVVAIVHQMRFVPLHRKIKELVGTGALGPISYMEGYYVHNLVQRAFTYDDWRKRDNATPLVYSGCHFVDLLRWFIGDEIVEVSAAANHLAFPGYPESDLNAVRLRFASGTLGHVLVAFGAAGPQDHSVRLYGQRLRVENNVFFREDGAWGGILHRPRILQPKLFKNPNRAAHHGPWRQLRLNLPAYLLGRGFEAFRWLARRPDAEYGARFYPVRVYEHALACVEAIEDFVDAIRSGRPPLCTVDEASKTVLACLAGVTSYRENRPVRVPSLSEALSRSEA